MAFRKLAQPPQCSEQQYRTLQVDQPKNFCDYVKSIQLPFLDMQKILGVGEKAEQIFNETNNRTQYQNNSYNYPQAGSIVKTQQEVNYNKYPIQGYLGQTSSNIESVNQTHPDLNQESRKSSNKPKKSNAYKIFANRFVSYFKNKQNFLKQLQEFAKRKNLSNKEIYKNIYDNLCKKVKHENRAQTRDDIRSMLTHKGYQQLLFKISRKLISQYAGMLKQSTKMINLQSNLEICKEVLQILEQEESKL